MISFKTSKFEEALISRIADRVQAEAKKFRVKYERRDIVMDLMACHCNGCPLDLNKLLEAPEGDFGHDVFGIRRFIDRSTGQLTQCFLPRCALPEHAVSSS